ncbi:sulfotransferase [Streptomyces sp. NPDC048277]|uniref:sulfotransferase n=1 Tax=Streptomyces sp. NPDC048277 TaxID=3155027 RepID=UPI0033D6D9CC
MPAHHPAEPWHGWSPGSFPLFAPPSSSAAAAPERRGRRRPDRRQPWSATAGTRRHARRLGPGAWREVRFEDLVADPESQLRVICADLGEDYDPAMTEPHRLTRTAVPACKTWRPPRPPHPRRPRHLPRQQLADTFDT